MLAGDYSTEDWDTAHMTRILRCELSDLPVDMCDHCLKGIRTLGKPLVSTNEESDFRFYRKSDQPGTCVCGKRFSTGDRIGWDTTAKWWRSENCCG